MADEIVRPRLTDALGLDFVQEDVDFAIPHLKEDIPLYLDPFLLWASSSPEYRALHEQFIRFFDRLIERIRSGETGEAARILLACGEPRELGLGHSLGTKRGSAIGPKLAGDIIAVLGSIPQVVRGGLGHAEVIQLLVPNVAEDRISDLLASIHKAFFIRFSQERSERLGIPMRDFMISNVYDHAEGRWAAGLRCRLPYNPIDGHPILFAPLDLLRHLPWINYGDYHRSYFSSCVLRHDPALAKLNKLKILEYNRTHYRDVEKYVQEKEEKKGDCKPHPLFDPLKVVTLRKKFQQMKALATGKEDGNDKQYEELACELLTSLLYPSLKYADAQSRTDNGVSIRDMIFYNDGQDEFLGDMRTRFESRQVVFELKNVRALIGRHVDQLFRYLGGEFGRFGVLVTRNPAPKALLTNTIGLYNAKRAIVLCIDDVDIEKMVDVMGSGGRPIDVLKLAYVKFSRLLPN